jgi:hemerythrin
MAITWRAQMSIDDGVIDDDHRCLIGLVNEADGITLGPAMPAELGVTLARLDAYTRIHFQREERL